MIHFDRFGKFDDLNSLQPDLAMDRSNQLDPTEARIAAVTDQQHRNRFRFDQEMSRLPDSRRQLIFRIRRQIDEGTYDTPEKMEIAVERMLTRIGVSTTDD